MKLSLAVIGLIFSLLPLLATAGGKLYFYHNDNRGAPVKMTDTSGKVVWSATYDPYGNAVVNDDPDGDGTKTENNIRLPGQYADEESSLHYNYYRTYDPETGRYLTSEPIGLDGGSNPYAYATGNPITSTDPSGLRPPGGPPVRPTLRPGIGTGSVLDAYYPPLGEPFTPRPMGAGFDDPTQFRDNIVLFPEPRRDPDVGEKQCPPESTGGGRDCKFAKLAGVTLVGRYNNKIQCQYRCPRKGKKILTITRPRSENPAFLCPPTIPERSFP